MSEQEMNDRFTPSVWNLIKSVKLTEDEQDKLRFMIEAKTHTLTYEEEKAILFTVKRGIL